jgi:integrase/recombinase XerD
MGKIGKAKVPSENERKRLAVMTKSGAHAKRNIALIACSYRIGLRAKELAALLVGSVLDSSGEILEQCDLTATMTKGGKPRSAFLSNPTVRKELKDYLDFRREWEGILFNLEAPLFKSQKGDSFSPNTMQQLLRRLHERAGIVGGRSHSGRRWFATELISKGVDIKAVSVLMGHSSVSMTAQYAEDNPQRLARIASELS